jgi:hypothetical protein
MRLGMLGLCLFVRKVFHPEGVGGALGVLGCGATMAAALAWDWPAQPEVAHYDDTLPSAMAVQLSLALPFAWSAVETGRHWSRSRRRLALGLVDPLVCHRVALWCLATVAFVGICGFAVAAGGLRAAGLEGGAALATAIRGILYLCVVGAVWLGLFPPAAYERHVTARARATV